MMLFATQILVLITTLQLTRCIKWPDKEIIDERWNWRERRVIGGDQVLKDADQPWLVSIRGHVSGSLWWKKFVFCGASVVSDSCVLTAAHCVEDLMTPKKWTIRMASRKLSPSVIDKIGNIFGKIFGNKDWQEFHRHPSKIVIHPGYNPSALWVNDVAIMKVDKKIPVGSGYDQIGKINLPPQGDKSWPKSGQQCVMFGWGCDKKGGSVVQKSRTVVLPKLSDRECQDTWGVEATKRLCAGRNMGSIGICPGDSGGPLVCKRNEKWFQAGIASFTSADLPGQRPGAFTRVSEYSDWIKNECGI